MIPKKLTFYLRDDKERTLSSVSIAKNINDVKDPDSKKKLTVVYSRSRI